MKVNWQKGFRRLLIVFSVLWIAFAAAVAVASPTDAGPWTKYRAQEHSVSERIQRAKDAGFSDTEILQHIQDRGADRVNWWESMPLAEEAPQQPTILQKAKNNLWFIFGPVVAVWVAYFAMCWVAIGFRDEKTRI